MRWLTDFGIATGHFSRAYDRHRQRHGNAALHVARAGTCKILDGRIDLYALGVVIYETLLGFPFRRSRRAIPSATSTSQRRRPLRISSTPGFPAALGDSDEVSREESIRSLPAGK